MKTILVCPQCGSPDIFYEIGGITGTYHCKKCDYLGPVIFEQDVEEVPLEKQKAPDPTEEKQQKRKWFGR